MTAEFKISRLKYTWKGQWADNTVYNPDDVISIGGKVYACLERHTSNVHFYNDLNFYNSDVPPLLVPKWEQVADGTGFRGNWQTATEYYLGDVVRVGNIAYICLEGHISAGTPEEFSNDLVVNSYWTVFFSGLEWRSSWITGTLYKVGDLVKWSGKSYVCNESHTSDSNTEPGLLTDISKWDEFIDGIKWRGEWLTSTYYYPNDLVKYGGTIYRCNTQHQSFTNSSLGLEEDQSFWDIEHSGIEFKGEWASTTYKLNDVVKYGSYLYRCIDPHVVSLGDEFDVSKFEIYVPGERFEGTWLSTTLYHTGDVVRHGGYAFAATITNINSEPTYDDVATNSNWSLLLTGTRIRGEWSPNAEYKVGDVVRRRGQLYFAKRNLSAGSDTDIIGDGSSVNSADWDLYLPGEQWVGLWYDDTTYLIGDVISFRGAAYKCIVKHLSDPTNRPDLGVGTYWEQYTYGDPNNVLTEVGDLKKFGSTRTENVSIGTTGQALTITSLQPGWKNFNASNAVYYVSTEGVDDPTRGSNLNSAWRTIRYALDNITGPATLMIKSGTYDEILPLRVPAFVAVVGDELRGVNVKPAAGYFTANDIDRYENILDFLDSHIEKVVTKVTIDKLGRVKQVITGNAGSDIDLQNITTLLNVVKQVISTGSNVPATGSNTASGNDAATLISLNRHFLQSEVVEFLRTSYPTYEFDEYVVKASVDKILQALVNDLQYSGNYETVRAANYLYNGFDADRNKIQNMFLLRDATGLRNMTLTGLEGELGPISQYLTRRPTAGAYASLDPGWGTAHQAVWVGTRSPYVQNVTTFGNACVGLKVDGTLHAGGNKTIVANDFTQILSDGIGVWTNADGGTEVVSVFTYYNHIGYLSTDGGRIRGTNGNCSYGEYGAVAEGFNNTEIPITGTVNNRYYDAIVGETFTNSSSILKLFYENAGQDYTTATFTVTGAGVNASLLADEFRDGAVHQVRLADLDGSTQPFGSGFTLAVNNAQAGDPYSITLAASSDQLESYYKDLRLVIPSGTGVGQYARVAAYDNTSKIVYVADERFSPYELTSSSSVSNDVLGVEASVQYGSMYPRAGDYVVLTGSAFGGLSNYTIYKIASVSASRFALEDTLGNPITLSDGTGSMLMHRLGWNHFQQGTQIEPTLNTTTLYSIEPRITFEKPNTLNYTETLSNTGVWTSATYGNGLFVVVGNGAGAGSTIASTSTDGITWTSVLLPVSSTWSTVGYGNGRFIILSDSGAGLTSTDGAVWTAITVPGLPYTGIAYGDGVWIAVARDGKNIARSTNGTSWSTVTLSEFADWSGVAYGKGIFVAVAESDSSTTQTIYSTDGGQTWTNGAFSGGCKSIAYGNNRFVAIEGGFGGAEKTFVSFDGINWQEGRLPLVGNWRSVAYGQGQFKAIANYESVIAKSDDGLVWDIDTLSTADDYRSITFGNPGGQPMFLAPIAGSASVIRNKANGRAQARAIISANKVESILLFESGSGYVTEPDMEVFDPNNISDAAAIIRIADGVLGSPSIVDGGEGYPTISTATTVVGDGFIDQYQVGRELVISGAQRVPSPGDNLRILSIDDYVYKVISATILNGTVGNYTLKLVIAKQLKENEAPDHGTSVVIRQNYSQVRLTNHDFLEIGLGNFEQTNYPNTFFSIGTVISPQNETKEANGGRVFYTSTDQDGNFRVGELFAVEQSTGTVTISADFFELEGLEELRIGGISVGGSGVVIREFSTDQLFTADSNNIVPTQKAIKAYLTRRISGGGSDAFTATFTAGIVRVGPQALSTTTLERLEFPNVVKFKSSYSGTLLAAQYFVSNNNLDDDLI